MLSAMRRTAVFASFCLLSVSALAQWQDVKQMGDGGETFVSTDGKGNVYATSHIPCKLYVSNDYGKTFHVNHDLPDGFCDVNSAVGPDGKLYVVYLIPGPKGVQVVTSADKGKTISKAGRIDGPYDREWIVVNPVTNEVGYNYSDGYIGGPKSKGVFYASSNDGARSFKTISRIDKEPEGSYPVDPYLAVGTGGRLYAAWACSYDYDKIDKYMFASSDDGGKSWKNHTTIGTTHPDLGDTQERWMLGSLVAVGKDTVMAIYEDYTTLEVDGEEERPLLAFTRISNDGGKTWSEARPSTPKAELESAIRSFRSTRARNSTVSNYTQTLPWVSADPKGRIHMAFEDNRSGQKNVGDKRVGLWHVRYAMWTADKGFGLSERVSHDWACWRPPLDFIGCCSDGDNVWITWTENPNKTDGWDFSGGFFIGKKVLKPAQASQALQVRYFPDTPENHIFYVGAATFQATGLVRPNLIPWKRGPTPTSAAEFAFFAVESAKELHTYMAHYLSDLADPASRSNSREIEYLRADAALFRNEWRDYYVAWTTAFAPEIRALGTSSEAVMAQVDGCRSLAGDIVALCKKRLAALGAAPEFPDVDRSHWAYMAIQALRDAGILAGYPGGTFGGKKLR